MGYSKKQNTSFNIIITEAKRKLLDLKRKHCLNETIDESYLILLINIILKKVFACIGQHKETITDRGRGPNNRNILPFFLIKATITESHRFNERHYTVIVSRSSSVNGIANDHR